MLRTLACALAVLLPPGSALAFALPGAGSWEVDAQAGVVSDYRYRGYSLSDSDPAAQAGLTLSHASGVYGDAYLSTIDEYGAGADGKGATVEATLTVGWAGVVAGFDADAALAVYRYPGGEGVNYYEIPVQIGQTYGPFRWALGASWAPRGQAALGNRGNRYVWSGVEVAPDRWPISLKATLGRENGAYAPQGKTDWLVGASAPIGAATLGLDYVDSDADKAALVASLFVRF